MSDRFSDRACQVQHSLSCLALRRCVFLRGHSYRLVFLSPAACDDCHVSLHNGTRLMFFFFHVYVREGSTHLRGRFLIVVLFYRGQHESLACSEDPPLPPIVE